MGVLCVGNESLGSVQDVAVALALSSGLHAVGIRARHGLGHGMKSDPLSADQFGQIFSLLFLGSESHQWNFCGPHVGVDGKDQPIVPATVSECLQSSHRGESVCTTATIFLRHRKALNAHLGAFLPAVPGKLLTTVALNNVV